MNCFWQQQPPPIVAQPCKRCGADGTFSMIPGLENPDRFYLQCRSCGYRTVELQNARDVIAVWNDQYNRNDYDILKQDVESLRDENKALRRGYTNMWYAHRNADPEMPHDYEKEAEKEAEQLLGDWKTVMTAQYGPAPDLGWFTEKEDDDGD
uniref:RNA polymerase I-like protein n=1 Tax=Siphoviridae sp. ct8Cp41 TaxID=2825358 RepID=A0A8S5UB75_9CAUD|nr:MAG TPA: RNA polymerase I-like protein [Siphoviridae sp. ct8Cp41]